MEFIKDNIVTIIGIIINLIILLFKKKLSTVQIFSRLNQKQTFKILNSILIIITFIILTVIILPHLNSKLQLTVFVTDTNNNVVLEQEGRINLSLGNRSLNETIGINGRVNFPDILKSCYGDSVIIGLDAKGWEIEGKNKFIFNGNPIYIKIKKDNSLGIINGIVKSWDGQQFINHASVLINTDTIVFTNSYGVFRIILPENMRVENEIDVYHLTISKEGYKTRTQYYSPNSSDFEIRLEKLK